MTSIEIEKLKLRADGKYILDIDQIKFQSPYVYGILGPNGSGKSTLLKAMCGIENRYEGAIKIDDNNVITHHDYISSITGSLIENHSEIICSHSLLSLTQ
ncbi:ATP-binding cassette domain-containing protein [Cuniculiplasma sp. SKW3]|uniref:ATP-binding cassette domain-containing protein n=1 Tax=Cuniculiplasma sp. SKW3 TaxID=3400170 RepID=UPI003FD00F7D